MTGDITQDFEPEIRTLEDLPTFLQIKNIFNKLYVDVSIEISRLGGLLITLSLLPVPENREAFKRINNYMTLLDPVEGQNSVIGSYGGRYYLIFGTNGNIIVGITEQDPMNRELATRINRRNYYAEVSRKTFVQLFREAQVAGFVR